MLLPKPNEGQVSILHCWNQDRVLTASCYVTVALGRLDCTSVSRTLWLRILNVHSSSATGCLCHHLEDPQGQF